MSSREKATRIQSGYVRQMRYVTVFAIIGGLSLAMAFQATAELMQVEVGGEIRMRGRYYINAWETERPLPRRIADNLLPWRPIGTPHGSRSRLHLGGPHFSGTQSLFKWDSEGKDWTRYETAVLLNVKADFSDNVTSFIELYDFHIWGEEFRSNYLTGADMRSNSVDAVLLNQAYIEMREVLDQPLRVRLGRQDLLFGKGFLVSNMMTPSQFITFDAIRLTYDLPDFSVDAFASKLEENAFNDDSDMDFYGVYGTYSGLDPVSISLYWMFIHDRTEIERYEVTRLGRWINSKRGFDYSATKFHTVGTRIFGGYEGFDYDVELAYQFGDASHMGARFSTMGGSRFGDTDAKYDNWGVDAIAGYTFRDLPWRPRFYVQGVLFEGQDNRDINFWEWLNPFYRPQASVSFNRLFTDKNYMPTVNDNSWISNVMQASAGIEVQPTEKLRVHAHVAKSWVDKPFNPPKSVRFGGRRIPVAPMLSFWTDEGNDDIGWEVAAWARYSYSQDLWFLLYGNYLWTGDGLAEGAFMHFNGTAFSGGSAKKNAGYMFWMAVLKF